MDNGKPDLARLSSGEIEKMLGRQGLAQSERDELVEELANRLADDVAPHEGGPAAVPPAPPPTPAPTPSPTPAGAGQFTPPPLRPAPVPTAPRRRRRISAGAAGLLALVLVAAVAAVALVVAHGLRSSDSTGSLATTASTPHSSDDPTPTGSDTPTGSPAGSNGLAGSTSVRWTLSGVGYAATLRIDHESGTADVSFVNPADGQVVRVHELLQLDDQVQNYAYAGYRAEDPATGESAESYYNPDVFVFREGSDGWVVTEVCDISAQACVPAR